ncbi:putative lumazine-binding protein [Mucilaginibacter frigoritolerans]|jgi:hypothetical protein|uniref:Putative lumazine-binding protein n=1 Tax=Mucilaginibacter frigoritolerans TaxID=652788 RepID=A0A562TNI2_9SPHI|nr:nuclear transport factor 2 family protein [Mucilaginibacter frigoritolerans]TWI94844.1 putative lumazine-binding protein [Mucilaginibacter frigoritolerans]
MKTLKSVLAGIALLFISVAANATVHPTADKPTKTDIINIYIDAITHGKANTLANVLDDAMEYDVQRGENVNALNKDQLIQSLKDAGTNDASVTTETTILADDDDASTVKVTFKYADYTRTDVVTLSKTNSWAITKVVTSTK